MTNPPQYGGAYTAYRRRVAEDAGMCSHCFVQPRVVGRACCWMCASAAATRESKRRLGPTPSLVDAMCIDCQAHGFHREGCVSEGQS